MALCLSCAEAGRGQVPSKRRLEVQRHLRRLNKRAVRSIKVAPFSLLSCFGESKVASQKKTPPLSQPWHQHGRCPKNTIPIRRTRRKDVLRASSIRKYGRKKHKSIPNPLSVDPDLLSESGHQHAIGYVEGDTYYGAKATINVWEPKIQQANEFSLSQLWILGGSFGEDLNSIEAGWQVFFCCTSIKHAVNFDSFGNDYVLGYWPSFLFSYLADSASMIEWGGEVVNSEPDGEHTSTAMGSGHFPGEGFGKASYFRNIQIVDDSNKLRTPTGVGTFTEQSSCYDVQIGNGGQWGHYFYYGGPGRNSNCP
ncbi:hypothetical protein B296_00007783 [Ensete ventricosum]|uniref:Neprosin PEP catalytic domain-containing protein n=1 Tax=Ensete ventricosum TaxID=4639 RepID=A0A427AZ13_ENSVE|nr:hypothetical protein B296_00007783 [Ensete ventricosum]